VTRKLQKVREGLGIGLRQFAREAEVSVSTLHGTEEGRPLRPSTAWKYAKALRKRGVDPNEVTEIRSVLGEVFFVEPDPYWKLQRHLMRSLREHLVALVRTGNEEAVRRLMEEVVTDFGEEGERNRKQMEEAHNQMIEEEWRREDEVGEIK
jgi:predicted transcriptional regulator